MSGWIITIDGTRPENWEIAKEHSVWATTRPRRIAAGDDLFFWMTKGGGLIAHAVAAEDAREVSEPEGVPWPDHAENNYASRFDLTGIVEASTPPITKWPQLQELGARGGANLGVIKLPDQATVARFLELFQRDLSSPIRPEIAAQVAAELNNVLSSDDARRFVERSVAERRGQAQFRQTLLAAYGNRCCISGCDAVPALEAAHITPYLGDHTNTANNGLLLRADLHTLFDLYELTIDADSRRVRLSETLKPTQYGEFEGRLIRSPEMRSATPQHDVLAAHNQKFSGRHSA